MNGRVYDPATAQFFSPDPFVQEAGNWQNYNRYSYVFNNPLIFTDPSGYRKKSLEDQKMDFLYQYDPVRDTSPVRVLSGGGDFGGTLSRYDINNAYRDVISSGYEGSVSDFTRLLSNTRDGKVSYWIDVENTRSYEQIKYYNSIFPEFLALGIIPELIKARKKITVDIGNTSEGWGNKSDPLLTINFNRGILQIETNFSKKRLGRNYTRSICCLS